MISDCLERLGYPYAYSCICDGINRSGYSQCILGNTGSKGNWFMDVFIVLSSVIIWKLGKYFNRDANEVYVNQATGETRRIGNKHTFFFIPMQYWAVGVIILEIVTIFA